MLGAQRDGVRPAQVLWAIRNPLKGSLRPQLPVLNQNLQLHPRARELWLEKPRETEAGRWVRVSPSEEQLVCERGLNCSRLE